MVKLNLLLLICLLPLNLLAQLAQTDTVLANLNDRGGDAGETAGPLEQPADAGPMNKYATPYDVKAWGVAMDAQLGTTGVTTRGLTSFNCLDCEFSAKDVGKTIQIQQGAAPNEPFLTTIAAYGGTHQITLGSPAANSASGQMVIWGTDDSAALQAILDYGKRSKLGGTILFPPGNTILSNIRFDASYPSFDIKGSCGPWGARVLAVSSAFPAPQCTTILDGAKTTTFVLQWAENAIIHGFNFIGFGNSASDAGAFIDLSGRPDNGAETLNVLVEDNSFWGKFQHVVASHILENVQVRRNASGCAGYSFVAFDFSHSGWGSNKIATDDNYVDFHNTHCPQTAVAGIWIKGNTYSARIKTVAIANKVLSLGYTSSPPFIVGERIAQSGLSAASFLNGQTVTVLTVGGSAITAAFGHADYSAADDGTSTSLAAGVANLTANRNEVQNLSSGTADGIRVETCLSCTFQDNDFEGFAYSTTMVNNLHVGGISVHIGSNKYFRGQYGIFLDGCAYCTVDPQYIGSDQAMSGIKYANSHNTVIYTPNFYSASGKMYVDAGGNINIMKLGQGIVDANSLTIKGSGVGLTHTVTMPCGTLIFSGGLLTGVTGTC